MTATTGALILALSYLLGSVDFAVLVGRMHGVDIHQVGSGNPGTSNVMRTLGRGPAAMVFIGDTLKGVIAAAIGAFLSGQGPESPWTYAAGLMAVIGHCYPVFHRFRGGKGVATGGGVILFAEPIAGLILTVLWVAIAKVGKVASVASLVVAIGSVPILIWQGVTRWALFWFGVMLGLVIYRHRGNISRIMKRRENSVIS
ncbi:MAG: glycerol-3-phosphate 1-O-acyltransferase PlsY [Actinobacteria bacterium]|nr:glycerol-3-phosphate 1-O-acyltransferase PlsY [Acidimicrobiia bacterium]MCA1735388.1 glycerol-3-phosphate 1-O-acyltransferase PlsY [Actinomycetota bacterium]